MMLQKTGKIVSEHADFVERVRRFAAEEVVSHSARTAREAEYPREVLARQLLGRS
jgi:Acyl-CoA dehydrogenase, N-terminal domain